MSKITLLFLMCLSAVTAYALPVSVDENVEFISAVARLAGYDEYHNNVNQAYVARLDSLMAPFKDHPAVEYMHRVRWDQGVSYDAVATLAGHTAIYDGRLVYLDGAEISNLDDRWKPGQGQEVVALLDDLYQQTGFSGFYASNRQFYDRAIRNAESLIEGADVDWLNRFYGKQLSHSRVVVSLINRGNYGCTVSREGRPDEALIIIGCYDLDDNAIPIFSGQESLIVHECSHPICNPLIEENLDKFDRKIHVAAELMAEPLRRGAYSGAKTMLCESMVRGAELQYALAHARSTEDKSDVEDRMRGEMSRGFVFMPEIMEAYVRNRGNVVDSMMPELIQLIRDVDLNARYIEIVNSAPKLIGCSIEENADNISPSDSLELRFFFDQPVSRSFGMNYLDGRADIMPSLAGVKDRISLDQSRQVLTVKIVAEPNKEYGFVIPGAFFRGDKGYRGNGAARVHFFTGE